ncbi:hypothetical protein VaNZ11_003607 [Volvox africanus]|uniref:Uncharacterized protein n=1 Tax=Volvox africanus TaxID=51714 RepID=A0ABQ5RUW0_9CHLO|nr:hypothetical protein VaNZ11_003607 [Volvox africanus]
MDSQHTFGHNLLSEANIRLLADQASHWAIILKFDNDEEVPQHALFPKDGLINIFAQGRLCRHTLIAGFRTTRAPKRPVPASFFRTLDFLLEYVAAGNTYRAINDKEEAKGFPPAAWCRPPVVSAREDAEAMTAAAVAGAAPEALQHTPPTDPIRLFYASRSWCCIYNYQMSAISVRLTFGVSPAEMYHLYVEGMLSEYLLMMGLVEEAPPTNNYVPPSVMLPLGALLYMHEHGRPYLPMTFSELRDVRSNGLMSIAVRPHARPMKLPADLRAGVDPAAAAVAAAMEPALVSAAARDGVRAVNGSGGTRSVTHMEPSAGTFAAGTDGRQAGGSGGTVAGQVSTAGGADGSSRNGRSRSPEPDPILDDASRWIMPKPFPAAAAPEAPSAASGDTAAAATASTTATATATANHGASDGGGNTASAVPAAVSPAAMLPSSHFLQYNAGVQPFFETPPLRLFLGDRGQAGLASNWWYVDSATQEVKGPYSPETMLLSSITPCREIHDETLVCGTDAEVRPPVLPPFAAFLPLGKLLHDISEGVYVLVTQAEIVSPLARSSLGNRIREPKPESPPPPPPPPPPPQQQQQQQQQTLSVTAAPVVIAAPVPQQQQQPAALTPAPVVTATAPVTRSAPHVTSATPVPLLVQAVPAPVRASSLPSQPPPSLQSQPQAAPVLQPPQLHPVWQQQPPPPQQQQPVQHATAVYSTTTALHGPVRGLPLPLSQLLAARSRPVPMAAAAVPAYTLPGGVVYLPQYNHLTPYSGQAVFAQPVLGNVPLRQPAPATASTLAPAPQQHH